MFRCLPTDSTQDARLQRLLGMLKDEFSAVDQTTAAMNFAAIEQRAHEAGRKLARLLCEEAASRCAESAERPATCPDCGQSCVGTMQERPLETRDGPIQLKEARHYCPQCRRVFFPQQTAPGPGSPQL
jgi:hypothetical protein